VKTSQVTGRSAYKSRTPFYRIAAQPCIRSVQGDERESRHYILRLNAAFSISRLRGI